MARIIDELHLATMTVQELEDEIRHHNRLYWDENRPEISDQDYDRLIRRLRELAPDSPVLEEMGPSEVGRIGEQVVHASPMLSLDKGYTDEDLIKWAYIVRNDEVKGPAFDGDVMVTPKMDGIAASLRFDERGRLAQAATRGSGTEGDDITANARTIRDIPARIPESNVEVRGEIYMKLSVFERFSEQFSNPRNLTAGAIKHKDPLRCQAYELSFAAYDLLGTSLPTERDKFERLEAMGFPPVERMLVHKDQLRQGYEHFASVRNTLDFEIDGVVYKANRVDEQERLGATAHHPRYAIAYKFQGEQATTILEEVQWSVARSGAITPVAVISPVTLSGAEVRRASLHNAGFLQKLGLLDRLPGAQVVVTRRGGVIPKVEFVTRHVERADADIHPIAWPDACPSCGGPVTLDSDFLYCQRPERCRDAIIGTLAHYCSVVDIQGFGEKLLAQAHDTGLLRSPVDLYTLKVEDLIPLERVGKKLATNLVQQVDEHRTIELATFLRALGIEELGKHVSTILAARYGTLQQVRAVTAPELAAIHTIGEIIAEKVVNGLQRQAGLIDRLLEQVTVTGPAVEAGQEAGDRPLSGQSFVFTGKLLAFDRKQAQQRVRALGGEAPGGVTKGLTFLVVGDGAEGRQSSKLTKAKKYIAEGATLKIISESEFLTMVGGL